MCSVRSDTVFLLCCKTVNGMDIRKHYTHTNTYTLASLLCADPSVKRVHMYIQSLPVGKSNIVELICLLVYFSYPVPLNLRNRWFHVGIVMHNICCPLFSSAIPDMICMFLE